MKRDSFEAVMANQKEIDRTGREKIIVGAILMDFNRVAKFLKTAMEFDSASLQSTQCFIAAQMIVHLPKDERNIMGVVNYLRSSNMPENTRNKWYEFFKSCIDAVWLTEDPMARIKMVAWEAHILNHPEKHVDSETESA